MYLHTVKSERRQPFVAIGTGRCGSVSLSKILNACRLVECGHEQFVTNWYTPNIKTLKRLRYYLGQGYKSETIFGEVQPHLLPHLPWLLSHLQDLKIICLHRPCEEVVASFMRRGPDKFRPSARPRQRNTKWVERLPNIEANSAEDAVRYYWDMYEKAMAQTVHSHHIQMTDLNNDEKLSELFDYLAIPESHRAFIENRKFNSADSTL